MWQGSWIARWQICVDFDLPIQKQSLRTLDDWGETSSPQNDWPHNCLTLRNQSFAAVSKSGITRYFVYVRIKIIFVTLIDRKYTVVKNICTCMETNFTEECTNSLGQLKNCILLCSVSGMKFSFLWKWIIFWAGWIHLTSYFFKPYFEVRRLWY